MVLSNMPNLEYLLWPACPEYAPPVDMSGSSGTTDGISEILSVAFTNLPSFTFGFTVAVTSLHP